jgi:CysZ protein
LAGTSHATRPVRDFASGVRLLGRGLALYGRNPGLVVLGLLPALITFLLLASLYGLLVYFIGDVASLVTWFADGWSHGIRTLARVLAGIAVLGAVGLVFVVGYTGITLALGDPFYEKISERVDGHLGGLANPVQRPWWRELLRGLGESLRMVLLTASVGALLFVAGFLPAVGQTVVPVLGALVGGWFLAVELTGVPFARRGMRLRQRRRVLRERRWLTLGFGTAVFLCFLIPLGAVLLMPAAVAGATLLTRRHLGQPS